MTRKIRVLVIDDSAFTRQLFKSLLSQDPAIEVVGVAPDPIAALDQIRRHKPDVLTLDVEMPRMDGLSFLRRLMREQPMPVVMVSSLTEAGCATTLRALELGAVDFVAKPRESIGDAMPEFTEALIEKVKAASIARLSRFRGTFQAIPRVRRVTQAASEQVIAVGASTGGTEALKTFLTELPPDCPGVLIVQHMPPGFTRAFAERLDGLCQVRVKEAVDGDHVLVGHVLIAPGDFHMRLAQAHGHSLVRLAKDAPVNRHRPSVDVLFHSCAQNAGPQAVGVLMTGMGEDGARGLLAMRTAGARTLAQDEASSVVFGMPRAAVELGAAERVVALNSLADAVMRLKKERVFSA
jgi:two-component system chemotaxis response regulator CheB